MSNKKYFYNLDGLRALAALVVVVGHIELVKKKNGILFLEGSEFGIFEGIFTLGSISVTFFFVLSGFLIT